MAIKFRILLGQILAVQVNTIEHKQTHFGCVERRFLVFAQRAERQLFAGFRIDHQNLRVQYHIGRRRKGLGHVQIKLIN